ncbi:MAG TPA: hypothetical protein VNO21_07850 [Polyangiaceae bacterium]|nr:hypothetical protein [Polyangiaceae bacterium]
MDILRAFPPSELEALIARLAIRIDPAKRLDVPSQVARVLVAQPDLRDSSRLPNACIELLHRVAEAKGSLSVPTVPAALEPLSARGLMFARGGKGAVELILPPAYLVQLRTWEGEDPRGLRALLAQASPETLSAIASHYLRRPATQPFALAVEAAWEALNDPERLELEIERLAPTERRLIDGVDREGGEVSTEELLELEREPLRLRSAAGPTPSRRGVGVSLERRGFLIPVYPNRHIVPTEVAALVGATRLAERAQRRERVKSFVLSGDHAPRRARFAADPAVLAIALAIVAREGGNEVRSGIGTPKSLVQRLATRFGRDPVQVGLIITLSRAAGLWDPSATTASAPPGSLSMAELTSVLFKTWRRGGAWDEARTEPELFRVSTDSRDPSPVGVLREMVLDAVAELAEGGWVPWSSLAGYLKSDDRVPGITRLLRRWSERVGVDAIDPMDVAARIVHESLPALGVLDLGEEGTFGEAPSAEAEGGEGPETRSSVTLRLTPRGRALVFERPLSTEIVQSQFLEGNVLRVGIHSRICNIMQIAPFVEVGRATDTIELVVAPQTLARALSAGFDPEALRQRLEALAPLPETLARTLAQASVVIGRGSFVAAGGFLWVDDANVREMLRTRRATAELFVDPSPPGGLIVQVGVDPERLSRRCRTIGVEIVSEGQVVRVRGVASSRPVSSRGTPQSR